MSSVEFEWLSFCEISSSKRSLSLDLFTVAQIENKTINKIEQIDLEQWRVLGDISKEKLSPLCLLLREEG